MYTIRILEDTELQTMKKKRGHRRPSRTRKRKYVKRYLKPANPFILKIELDEDNLKP